MSKKRTLLRNATALLGDALSYDPQPLDVLVEDGRIAAIAPAGTLGGADVTVDLSNRLLVPGLANVHVD